MKEIQDYLGDAVYAKYDGYMLTLYTSDGIHVENVVYLEPQVVRSLIHFIKRMNGGE